MSGILYKNDEMSQDLLVVPKIFRQKVFRDFHDNPMIAHPGIEKTTQIIKTRFFWPNMKKNIEKYYQI